MLASRLGYEESCLRLQGNYLDAGHIPPIPDHVPQSDDDGVLGVSFFRMLVNNSIDLGNLTIPRTFFGRSDMKGTSFKNTDFTESNLCWNDFMDVDFSNASLVRCDMRASLFVRVKFVDADISESDMRQSSFENCDFTHARMTGVVLTLAQVSVMALSDAQRGEISIAQDDGDEPCGG